MRQSDLATMTRRLLPGFLLVVLAVSACSSGCRQQVPQSELEKFMAQYRGLPAAVFLDTLRAHTSDAPPYATYAHYELGNYFYGVANDSAQQPAGWDTDLVTSLLDSAQAHFENAITLDSTFVEAYVNLGSLWDDRTNLLGSNFEYRRQRGEYLDRSKELYERALVLNPDDEKAGCNLGALHLKLREHSEAIACFNQVLAVNPQSALAHYNLAIMFAEEKIYREALVEWGAAAAADPDGDIGERSRANIQIVKELLSTEIPENLGEQ